MASCRVSAPRAAVTRAAIGATSAHVLVDDALILTYDVSTRAERSPFAFQNDYIARL